MKDPETEYWGLSFKLNIRKVKKSVTISQLWFRLKGYKGVYLASKACG